MTSVSENPAVTNPKKHLSKVQQDALGAIQFFRHQQPGRFEIRIGNKRFSKQTITALENQKLVTCRRGEYTVTIAGGLALDKLKGGNA
ncbi:hypothetical protein ACRQ1B_06215 [Rhizobium panacihumi]|uniref:hypothetical protein n=1 Tax=Rhizobium panacihumi TaxID=2008450 RepID=UPI003D7A5DD1